MGARRVRRPRRWLLGAGVFAILFGTAVTAGSANSLATEHAHQAATDCPPTRPGPDCLQHRGAVVAGVDHSGRGVITLTWSDPSIPAADLAASTPVAPGDRVAVELWHGVAAAVDAAGQHYLTYAVSNNGGVGLAVGIVLLALGFGDLLALGVSPRFGRPRP